MKKHATEFGALCASLLPENRSKIVTYALLQSAEFYPHLDPRDPTAARNTVLYVDNEEELSLLLRTSYEQEQPVYVRQGSGQVSIDHLAPFPPGSVIIDLRRLKEFVVDREDGLLDVGPSLTLHETNRRLREHGYEFPLSVGPVTWGGLVSTNTSGHLVDALSGKPGDYVMGMRVVLPDGTIVATGTRAQRKITGPDLTRVFVGNQCLFGVITQLTLRLPAAPRAKSFGWAAFPDIATLIHGVREIYSERLPIPALGELVESRYSQVSGIGDLTAPGELLMLGTTGDAPESSDWRLNELLSHMASGFGARVKKVDADLWDRLWTIRESPHHYISGTYLLGEVIDTPLSALNDTLAGAIEMRRGVERDWPGVQGYLWGHIGAGSIHPAFSCDKSWSRERMTEVATDLRRRVGDLRRSVHGSCGEQGIYPEHADWYVERFGETVHELNKAMKRAFDPKNLLNPARIELAGSAA